MSSDPSQPRDVGDIIREHFQSGTLLDAFEAIYANARKGGRVPWDEQAPTPLLTEWFTRETRHGHDQPALVIGCGLGDDAEYLAAQGYRVTAFDLSATAIEMCRARFPNSSVQYEVADLFALPEAWTEQFAFVLESRTIQALPWDMSAPAITAIARCVRPGGELLVLCLRRDPNTDRKGIPWPLSRDDLAFFQTVGLREKVVEEVIWHRPAFRVLYEKPASS